MTFNAKQDLNIYFINEFTTYKLFAFECQKKKTFQKENSTTC